MIPIFTERKITAFQKPISHLADEPRLKAAELKAYFDASPEQLRQAVNGLADDGAALTRRVDGILNQTFQDAIREDMLSQPLAAKLNGKAELSALEEETRIRAAAIQARTAVDNALLARMASAENRLSTTCGLTTGFYNGNAQPQQDIVLGFRPKAALVFNVYGATFPAPGACGGLAVDGKDCEAVVITDSGFRVFYGVSTMVPSRTVYSNSAGVFLYLAFRDN